MPSTTSNFKMPASARIRLHKDGQGNHVAMLKPSAQREPHAGVTRMTLGPDGLSDQRLASVIASLAADCIVAIICPDIDAAFDAYADLDQLLTEAQAAARASHAPARVSA